MPAQDFKIKVRKKVIKILTVISAMSLLRWIISSDDWMDEDYPALYGSNDFVEYHPGNTNLIISIPHGGEARPPYMKDRVKLANNDLSKCESSLHRVVVCADRFTLQIGKELVREFSSLTGLRPHVVLTNLHRIKLDVNRPLSVAIPLEESELAEKVYHEYHNYLRLAASEIGGPGLLLDIHGQNHGQNCLELGYLLTRTDLNSSSYQARPSSIESLSQLTGLSVKDLVVGSTSLGAHFHQLGYKAVPSPAQTSPGEHKYFSGGYITQTHGSSQAGVIDAIQVEIPGEIRGEGGEERRQEFARDMAQVVTKFMQDNYQ